MPNPTRPTPIISEQERIDAFWKRVDKTDSCWMWIGSKNSRGYGNFNVRTSDQWMNYLAHRLSWAIANNQEVATHLVVRHGCDIPLCVNPDHLTIGTQKDNIRDAWDRGRLRMKMRCMVCFGLRDESWVVGSTVMCAKCYSKQFTANPIPVVIPLEKLVQLPMMLELSKAA
jgi:hypothetical protein